LAPVRRLPPLLRRAWFRLNQAFRRRIAHLEITPDQFTALRSLSEAGTAGLTQQALTDLMSSDPNTIASLLERMEEAGLVRRDPDPADGRVKRVRVTPNGDQRLAAARSIALELQAEALAVLPAREHEKFLARLECVADACREAAERSPGPRRAAANPPPVPGP
jgi:DNA-binding MarR family transcriptional regulator